MSVSVCVCVCVCVNLVHQTHISSLPYILRGCVCVCVTEWVCMCARTCVSECVCVHVPV